MEKIDTLSIDIESFSDRDLRKCGVYRYSESPNAELLLFGYSVNNGPVEVIDVAQGEEIPEYILAALVDDEVTKWAYNSSFERVFLSVWLRRNHPEYFRSYGAEGDTVGDYLNPSSWRCSMVWGAYMGLPLSLKGVGAVLKLDEQKMTEGSDLIRYFCVPCKPTKSNGGRTRNLPSDAPDKWATFKAYNKRDVEVELAIKEKLKNFPVPEFIWDEYHLDQQINDRGIGIDMELVSNAILFDEKSKGTISEQMKGMTDLENPNSVVQMKAWLSENGVETDTLGKKAVEELMKDCPEDISNVLALRQQLAKSSVKKYQAMANAVCDDGRARGMFQFYGANRTGRWCLTGDHEVLTSTGWQRLDEWTGGPIACWNSETSAVSFQDSAALVFDYSGPMYTYKDVRIDQCSTPDHKMRVQKYYGAEWTDMTAEEISHCRPCIPLTGYRHRRTIINNDWLRVMVMTQADGTYTNEGSIHFHFRKKRKVERCKHLLRKAGITFTAKDYKDDAVIKIPGRMVPLWLREFRSKTFGQWLLDEDPDVFFDELPHWDGSKITENSIQYTSVIKANADLVQALAHISGRCASMCIKNHSKKNDKWNDAYVVNIWLTPGTSHEIKVKPIIEEYSGKVYCASTSTGYFLVRRNGKVWVTGNSGRIIQLQNLRRNDMPDLSEARELVRQGDYESMEILYDDIPDTLSQLVRTAFIPKPGHQFYVADFSAIEARVIACIAGETWRNDLFAQGGDIYCQSASKMFKVPVEKHGINGHLRQKGKIAELACIAEGSPVLTDKGLIPIEKVTPQMKVWDGESWVEHGGVVFKGEREVIKYEGLTATPDHLVWVEGQQEPIQFGIAASSGAHLVKTGDGGNPIRLGENHQSGKTMEQELEPLLCSDRVPELRNDSVAAFGQPEKRKVKRLSGMLPTKTNSNMAGKKTYCSKTTMRESFGSQLPELWSKRTQILFYIRSGCRSVLDKRIWSSRQVFGTGQNRYERRLCSREPALCLATGEPCKPAQDRPVGILAGILALFLPRCSQKTLPRHDERRDYRGRRESSDGKKKKLAHNISTVRLYDIRNAGPHHRFTVSDCLVHNCGYGGSVGALKAMGALEMGLQEEELQPLVDAWRASNPKIVQLWWDVDEAVKTAVKMHITTETHGIKFSWRSGMMFIHLPSGRKLCYVKPRIGENKFGGESVTYEGIGATKKWERLESYGPKFVENIVQAISRDLLMNAMKTLSHCFICGHVHDELIIECKSEVSLDELCRQMARVPEWMPGILLRADGYVTDFYKKD